MTEILEGQVGLFAQDTWSGKTSLEPCPQEPQKEKISVSSSKKLQGSSKKMPLFLSLRKKDGISQDASWETGGALLGEYTMHSFGEQPYALMEECLKGEPRNGVSASRLSQILEAEAPQKYYLSAKACEGILRRAEKRGKELPKELREALEKQAIPSKSGGREIDSLGNRAGKGPLVQKELSATLGVSQDQTLFAPAVAYGISPYESKGMLSDNPRSGIYKADTSRTLDLNGGTPACNQGGMAIVEPTAYALENHPNDSRVKVSENGIVQALNARMGPGGATFRWDG